jgi:hypothetical protein
MLNLVSSRVIHLLLLRLSTDYNQADYVGTSALLIAFMIWDSIPPRLNPTSGCGPMATLTSTLVYVVDDLAIIARNPQEIADVLMTKHKFKLKGTGPIKFHLNMDFFHDRH